MPVNTPTKTFRNPRESPNVRSIVSPHQSVALA
jgi:hypothetical protein